MCKKLLIMVLICCLIGCVTGCKKDEKKVVIASKPMTEQLIIVEMLTKLIEEKTDIQVEQKMSIGGGTSNIHPAMEKGDIDLYPEYTGTGWLFILKETLIKDPEELYEAVKKGYDETYNITWLDLYGFNNTFGLAIKETLADAHDIETYTDLAKVSDKLSFAAEYDFFEREDGYPGLVSAYGFQFKTISEIDIGLKYQAIGEDEVDVINVFSTDGRLKEIGLVVLEDDQYFFPNYAATTIVRQEILEKYPELEEVLNTLGGQINNEEMIQMNYLVEIEKQEPKQVAVDFLEKKGLLP